MRRDYLSHELAPKSERTGGRRAKYSWEFFAQRRKGRRERGKRICVNLRDLREIFYAKGAEKESRWKLNHIEHIEEIEKVSA